MKSYEAAATIAASPEAVWAILVDGAGYAGWDSGVISVDGTIGEGERITVVSEVSPKRSFPVTVSSFEPGRRMECTGGMPLGLFRGVRSFTLAAQDDGSTAFAMREEYRGPLLPLMWRMMPDLGPSFRQFAEGLKARAEAPS